jgi:hypothetical protein
MKKSLMLFWYKCMAWESKRLRNRSAKIADRLVKACEQEANHNDRLAEFESIVNMLLSK